MKAPAHLSSAGRAAWRQVVAIHGDRAFEACAPVVERYARAVDLAAALEAEWQALGRPVLAAGQKGSPISHPLVPAMGRQATVVARLANELRITPGSIRWGPGRPKAANSAPDRAGAQGSSRLARLRPVGTDRIGRIANP